MTLTPEQKQTVASWIAAGDNLSAVQKKLIEQFQITLTYRDVRFLVDDLNLELKDPAPKVDTTDLSKVSGGKTAAAMPNQKASPTNAPVDVPDEGGLPSEPDTAADLDENAALPSGGSVSVEVDKVTLLPGALASGTVKFSDGVTGKWVV